MAKSQSIDRHLLIDGYNVIHAWPELKALFKKNIEVARNALAKRVRVIHDMENLRVTVVFDSQEGDIEIERSTPEVTFSLLYSSKDLTADSVIEALIENRKKGQAFTLASNDNLLKAAVIRLGAVTVTAEELMDWVIRCEERQSTKIKNNNKEINKSWKQAHWKKHLE